MKTYLLGNKKHFFKANLHCHTNLTDGKLSQKYCATVSKATTKQAVSYIEVYSQDDLMNMSNQNAGYQLMNEGDRIIKLNHFNYIE